MTTTTEKKVSNHKIRGKHALKHDSIFKGRLEEQSTENDSCYLEYSGATQNFDTDVSTAYHFEKENPYEYRRLTDLKNELHMLITEHIKLDLSSSRRRPSRVSFNTNYAFLVNNMDKSKYSLTDIFVEFAFYFSENVTSMFKLLNTEWKDAITRDLYKKSKNPLINNIDNIEMI